LNGQAQFETSDSWGVTASGTFSAKKGDVIAIQALNFDGEGTGNPGAIIADINLGGQQIPTSEKWKCAMTTYIPNRENQLLTWRSAVTLGANGVGPWDMLVDCLLQQTGSGFPRTMYHNKELFVLLHCKLVIIDLVIEIVQTSINSRFKMN
jgi:hypothetical protein